MTYDRPILGITLMILFCIFAPLGDALAKILGGAIPLVELVLIRFVIQSILLIPLAMATNRPMAMDKQIVKFAWLRVILHITGIAAMFSALQFLPLADAIAIAFVMPFLLLIAGYLWMNETVGMHRFLACVVGFVGTTLVIQPSFQQVGWPALLPIVVAIAFSGFILTTRHIAQQTDPIGLQAINGIMATVIILPVLLIFATLTDWAVFSITLPSSAQFGQIIIWGCIGTLAHLLMTWSLRFAPSSTLAPMQYLEIPIAAFFGWIFFQEFPNTLAGIGIAITVAAGLYIIYREHANAVRLGAHKNIGPEHHAAE